MASSCHLGTRRPGRPGQLEDPRLILVYSLGPNPSRWSHILKPHSLDAIVSHGFLTTKKPVVLINLEILYTMNPITPITSEAAGLLVAACCLGILLIALTPPSSPFTRIGKPWIYSLLCGAKASTFTMEVQIMEGYRKVNLGTYRPSFNLV